MALRSPALWMGNPAVQHTAQNDRLMLAGLHRPEPGSTAANRPLTAASGVIVGPPGTMGEVTLLSNTQFTVNPARWVIYSSASALGGTYKVVNDAVETLGITAQNVSQYRRSYFGVWVIDSFVAGSGDDLPHWGIVDGALAASAGVAALPSAGSLPANFLALGEFLIPPVGQAVTYTPYDVRTGLRGGILPVTATDARAPAFDGQYRDHPTAGLQRGKGGAWGPPVDLDRPVMRLSIGSAGYPVPTNFTDNMAWTVRDDPTGMAEGAGPTWTFVTVARGGYYQVNLGANFATVGTYRIGIMMQTVGQTINGASGLIGKIGLHGGAGGDTGVSVSDLVYLTAGQRLRCGLYHDLAGNSSIGPVEAYATSFWSMAWLRP